MVMAELTMFPFDKGEHLSEWVAGIIDIIDKSGLLYQLNPMGTVIEGEWDEILALITKCFKRMSQDSKRISINIKIDYKEGNDSRIEKKVDRIEEILNKSVKR